MNFYKNRKKFLVSFLFFAVVAFASVCFVFTPKTSDNKAGYDHVEADGGYYVSNCASLSNLISGLNMGTYIINTTGNMIIYPIEPYDITIKSGLDITINFEGNIGARSIFTKSFFTVENGATLTFTSDNEKGIQNIMSSANGALVYVKSGGKFNLNGGCYTLCGTSGNGLFYVEEGGTADFNNGRIIACNASYGGAIYSLGTLNYKNTVITKCEADYNGGAICASGQLNLDGTGNGVIEYCSADMGGAIYATGENTVVNIKSGYFNNNNATFGGVICAENIKTLKICGSSGLNGSITQSTFLINYASCGGVIYAQTDLVGTEIDISDSVFRQNVALDGGAVYICGRVSDGNYVMSTSTEINIKNCKFGDNISNYQAGAIYVEVPTGFSEASLCRIERCDFVTNTASTSGGAVSIVAVNDDLPLQTGYRPIFSGNNFEKNSSGTYGGAISVTGGIHILIDDYDETYQSVFNENSSEYGGDISFIGGALLGELKIDKAKFIATLGEGVKAKSGGAIYAEKSAVVLKDVAISSRHASTDGGAIYCTDSDLTICPSGGNRNLIDSNSATENGGAINAINCNVSVKNTDFTGNRTTGNSASAFGGGAVCCLSSMTAPANSSVSFDNCTFTENKTDRSGSAMYISSVKQDESLLLKDLTVKNNASFSSGMKCDGTIYVARVKAEIDNCLLKNNVATYGAGFYFAGCSAKIFATNQNGKTTIAENNANSGAGIYCSLDAEITIENAEISNNTATDSGGGIYSNQSILTVKDGALIKLNSAVYGGGIYSSRGLNLEKGEISLNYAQREGGGVYIAGTYSVTGGTIYNNNAYRGGGIYFGSTGNTTNLYNVKIDNNTATEGGGIFVSNMADVMQGSGQIVNNIAPTGGGVYVLGSFAVNGGTISGNGSESVSSRGGGIYSGSSGRITINAGEIKNNTAEKGYALYTSNTLYVYGGQISENVGKLPTHGSAVYVNSGRVEFGKTAYIFGNKDYAQSVDDVFVLDNTKISLSSAQNAPTEGFKLGIYAEKEVSDKIILSGAASSEILGKIVYESDIYGLSYKDGNLKLFKRLYITALDDNVNITFEKFGGLAVDLEWSFDCAEWHTVVWDENSITVNIPLTGDKLFFLGNISGHSANNYLNITANGEFSIIGDLSSIIEMSGNLTDLPNYAYYKMFENCNQLVDAIGLDISADTFGEYAYAEMFKGCTKLVSLPELSATTLSKYCYENMFSGCESLTDAPLLPATVLADYCYSGMFSGCKSLTVAPLLLATEVKSGSYQNMFKDCISLTATPLLTADTIDTFSYAGMFSGCFNLTDVSDLIATAVPDYAYQYMFKDCKNLKVAPKIYATSVGTQGVIEMFNGCSSLEVISVSFVEWDDNVLLDAFENWVNGVPEKGVFVCPESLSEEYGASRIPQGWVKSEKTMVVSISVNGEIRNKYYVGKPYGTDSVEFEFPNDPAGYPEGYRFGGWSYSENGDVFNSDRKFVWRDETIYAVWLKIPTIKDENGQSVDESENTWYASKGILYIVKSKLSLSGTSELPIIFTKDCKEVDKWSNTEGEVTFKDLTVKSQRGFGIINEVVSGGEIGARFSINVDGDNYVFVDGNYVIDNGNSTARIVGIYSKCMLSVQGSGLLKVETQHIGICDPVLKAQNYAIYSVKSLTFSGDGLEVELKAGDAENIDENSHDSSSVAIYSEMIGFFGKQVVAYSGDAISTDNPLSAVVLIDVSFDMYNGIFKAYAGVATGNDGVSCAIYGEVGYDVFDIVTIEGLEGDPYSCGSIFMQSTLLKPLIFSCLPKIVIERAVGDETEYALDPGYGIPSEDLFLYNLSVYNLIGEMEVGLECFDDGEWIKAVYDEEKDELIVSNIEGITVKVKGYTPTGYGIIVSTTETTNTGSYKFRITNGLLIDNPDYLSVDFEVKVGKTPRTTPSDIVVVLKTDDTIKIKAESDGYGDYEYTIDNTVWVKGTGGYVVFTNLMGGKAYTVKVRAPETENLSQSKVNGNCIIETYTHLAYVKVLANDELISGVGENPPSGLKELLVAFTAEIDRCYNEAAVLEAKKNAQAKIYIYMQKEDRKSTIENSVGQNQSPEMQVLIKFVLRRIDFSSNLEELEQAFKEGQIDVLRQLKKEDLDVLILSIGTGTKEFNSGVDDSKKFIDNAITEEDVLSAYAFAETRIRFYAERDGKIFEIDKLVGDGEISVELLNVSEEEKNNIRKTETEQELSRVYAHALGTVSLRLQKDGTKNSIDKIVGEEVSKELKIYVEKLKSQIDDAENTEKLSELSTFAITEVENRKAEEDLIKAKAEAKDEIYGLVSGNVSLRLKSTVQTVVETIESATTAEEVELAKASGLSAVNEVIDDESGIPVWGVVSIVFSSLAIAGAVAFFIVKKYRPIKIIRK